MTFPMRLAAMFSLSAALCLAENWSGPLVDSKCYGAEQRNVNPTDTETFVDRDRSYEIHYCSPTHKTKYFAIVGLYGERLKFDSAGNTKAADLVRNVTKKHVFQVAVTGEMAGDAIRVDSISQAPQR